jgi:hypothetical protein
MPVTRIKTRPEDLRDQLTQAIAGITALGAGWPGEAPTLVAVTAARDALATAITDSDNSEALWKTDAEKKRTRRDDALPVMKAIDEATDLLYGPNGAAKNNFGLTPRDAGTLEPLHVLLELSLTNGPAPGSLRFDWESIDGASYEVQWSSTADFSVLTGSAVSASASDYIISGLVPGTQYWARVQPVRGGQTPGWSLAATHLAPV